MREIHRRRIAVLVSIACLVAVALPAAAAEALDRAFGGGGAASIDDVSTTPAADPGLGTIYLSLGDSLSASFQPNGDTRSGYSEQVFQLEQAANPDLRLVKLGCPGERTNTIDRERRICPYAEGSQLDQAVEVLGSGDVAFVTLQIGSNDTFRCFDFRDAAFDHACVEDVLPRISDRLTSIVQALQAADPEVPIVGVNYLDPLLALAIVPGFPPEGIVEVNEVWTAMNDTLEQTYATLDVPVADVEAAFSTSDFDTIVRVRGFGELPLNSARICQWTVMCITQGGDPHPNTIGYAAMARAVEDVLATALAPTGS